MRFLGACVGAALVVVVTGVGGVGCHAGAGVLAGAGGGGILSGAGGKAAGGRGGGSAILGFAGAGLATGAAGYPDNGCGAVMPAVRLPAEGWPESFSIPRLP